VIDACAGSGGKTLALADILFRRQLDGPGGEEANEGPLLPAGDSRLIAMDVAEEKLEELARRAREAGVVDHIERFILLSETGPLPLDLPAADLVLVDAPCSGLGTLRRNPELKLRYGPDDVKEFARLQLSILERFAPLVKEGGRLAYIVCSFLRAECEGVAAAFQEAHPEFAGVPSEWAATRLPPLSLGGNCIRLDPVLTATDAFFIALWRKHTGVSPS
jgi:16S rRNA (cytosine967-C5)-methyltransferase